MINKRYVLFVLWMIDKRCVLFVLWWLFWIWKYKFVIWWVWNGWWKFDDSEIFGLYDCKLIVLSGFWIVFGFKFVLNDCFLKFKMVVI